MPSKVSGVPVNQDTSKTRFLVVDDEVHIRSSLVRALNLIGYEVDEAASGQEALALLQQIPYDLMVLDMVMPGIEGVEVLRQVEQIQPDMSIIILTGNATVESAIAAIKSAAVDYLLKPASIHEIIDAITKALQKRTAWTQKKYLVEVVGEALGQVQRSESASSLHPLPAKSQSRFIIAQPLQLDRTKREVLFADNPERVAVLSKGETAVLSCLMQEAGHILSCKQLAETLWGYEIDQFEAKNVIRPYIFRLRQKIENDPKKPQLIQTVRRRGYRFVPTD
jgi:DNA-binding response OmpR family regulator